MQKSLDDHRNEVHKIDGTRFSIEKRRQKTSSDATVLQSKVRLNN